MKKCLTTTKRYIKKNTVRNELPLKSGCVFVHRDFVGLMKMEPNSPEMQTLYDKYVRFARSNSELTDKSVARDSGELP